MPKENPKKDSTKQSKGNQFLCEHCFPESEEIAEFIPGCWLCEHEGKYVLVTGQGHNGDIFHIFTETPTPDPDPNTELEISDEADKWLDTAEEHTPFKDLSIDDAMWIVPSIVEAGFDKPPRTHKMVEHWLWNRAGEMIEKWKNGSQRSP